MPSVLTKSCDLGIEHHAVIALFNEVLKIAHKKQLLSGGHFSEEDTLIRAWAGHKSFIRKNDNENNDNDDQSGNGSNDDAQPQRNTANSKASGAATTPTNRARMATTACIARATPLVSCGTWAIS